MTDPVKKRAPAAATAGSGAPPRPRPVQLDPTVLDSLRGLFWHNVVREMLTGLAAAAEKRPELLDGRFGILTHGGERIPIAAVAPILGMTVRGSREEEAASVAVQMTVFRIATPDGEVFTLPVSEVRAFHELTPELLERLEQAEHEQEADEHRPPSDLPFGFAAFRALPKLPPAPAPSEPGE